jgi:hypothetical protein
MGAVSASKSNHYEGIDSKIREMTHVLAFRNPKPSIHSFSRPRSFHHSHSIPGLPTVHPNLQTEWGESNSEGRAMFAEIAQWRKKSPKGHDSTITEHD